MESIDEKVKKIHGSDTDQLEFVFSQEKKIIVTAPAGCGKTKSMISKIAYQLGTNRIMYPKKILAMTFSVNAATKIKDEVKNVLPSLFEKDCNSYLSRIDVSNYHNFSLNLIKKHGYFLDSALNVINDFNIISDDNNAVLISYLTSSEIDLLKKYDTLIKECKYQDVKSLEDDYYLILKNRLFKHSIITFNGLLLCAIKLLENKQIKNFYNTYYEMVIIDEFQDTNILSLRLVDKLIGNNNIILMGDDLQKIYGFLGAIPNIFDLLIKKNTMHKIEFKTNHRFNKNIKMKNLDAYIRSIDNNYDNINNFSDKAEININISKDVLEETKYIVNDVVGKLSDASSSIAILFRSSYNSTDIVQALNDSKVKYFNALFNDTDIEYKLFHEKAYNIYFSEFKNNNSFSNKILNSCIDKMKNTLPEIITNSDKEYIFYSLLELLKLFFTTIKKSINSREDKHQRICYILGNGSLKHMISEIDERVILTTIHSSKGLEWDYVYIPEITAYSFPTSKSICKRCREINGGNSYEKYCTFKFSAALKKEFEAELSVFYVALTRAKKDVYFFANNGKNPWGYPKKISCLLFLPNLKYNKLT